MNAHTKTFDKNYQFHYYIIQSLCLGHMRITGSPGSYGPVRLGNPYGRVIRGMLLRCSGHMQTGGVRVFYGVSTVSRRCFGEGVARTRNRTVTVRCMYGSVRYMCEHHTDPYVLENTRRILRSLYVARTGPGDGRECTYEFLAPYDYLRAFYGKKKMCMHNFQTQAAYGHKGSTRAEKNP